MSSAITLSSSGQVKSNNTTYTDQLKGLPKNTPKTQTPEDPGVQPFLGVNWGNPAFKKFLPSVLGGAQNIPGGPTSQGGLGVAVYFPQANTVFATTAGKPIELPNLKQFALKPVIVAKQDRTTGTFSAQVGVGNAHELLGTGNFAFWNVRKNGADVSRALELSKTNGSKPIVIGNINGGILTTAMCPQDTRGKNPGNAATGGAVGTGFTGFDLVAKDGKLEVSDRKGKSIPLALFQAGLSAAGQAVVAANLSGCKVEESANEAKKNFLETLQTAPKNLAEFGKGADQVAGVLAGLVGAFFAPLFDNWGPSGI
jgi:hypothetical protein